MEKLYVFGTGNAQATRCYNTCFAIRDEDEYFMVDAGGGNGILRVLEDMDVDLCHIDVYKRQGCIQCPAVYDKQSVIRHDREVKHHLVHLRVTVSPDRADFILHGV